MGALEEEFPEASQSDLKKVAKALRRRDVDAALRAIGFHPEQRRQRLDEIFIEFDQKHFSDISALASAKKIKSAINRYEGSAWVEKKMQTNNPEDPDTPDFFCWEALYLCISIPGYESIKRVLRVRSVS